MDTWTVDCKCLWLYFLCVLNMCCVCGYDPKLTYAKKIKNYFRRTSVRSRIRFACVSTCRFLPRKVKVTNSHIKLIAVKIQALPKYKNASAKELKFSNQWLKRWKERLNRQFTKRHMTKAKPEDIDTYMTRRVKAYDPGKQRPNFPDGKQGWNTNKIECLVIAYCGCEGHSWLQVSRSRTRTA